MKLILKKIDFKIKARIRNKAVFKSSFLIQIIKLSIYFPISGCSNILQKDDDWLYSLKAWCLSRDQRVERVLAEVCSQHDAKRKGNTAKILNLFPYRADYFGHKRRMDQNEKLVVHGAKHVLAIDCHCRFIADCSTMPIKNAAIFMMRFMDIFFIASNSKRFLRRPYTTYFCFQKDHDLIKIVIKFSYKSKRKPRDQKKLFSCVFMRIFSLL